MQVQVIQDLIAQGVDALAVVPVDPAALEPVLGEAMKKGIVVVTHEASTQQNTMYDLEAFTNASFGQTIMESLATAMGHKGLYTTMVGNVTNASHNEWADAGVAYATAKYPEMKLLDAEPRVEIMDNLDTAYDRAKELFKKYPDLRGIMGTSSLSAPGVSRAIEELGLQGRAFVSSAGLPNENKPFLKDGTLQSVVLWDPKDAGYALCALAAKVIRGGKFGNGLDLTHSVAEAVAQAARFGAEMVLARDVAGPHLASLPGGRCRSHPRCRRRQTARGPHPRAARPS